MTSYISLEIALRMFANGYLFSTILLLAVSYFGLAAIEMMEKSPNHSPKPKWFS